MNTLVCGSCGWRGPEALNIVSCPKCGKPLDLDYRAGERLPEYRELLRCHRGVWCFSELLPGYRYKATLGEGFTRVLQLRLQGSGFLAKMESQNPTGSFKDRGAAVAISMAISLGAGVVVEDSSGNAGIATSCYSRAHGVRAVIVAPASAPIGKLDLIRLCGAEVVLAESREHASRLAPRIALERAGAYLPHTWLPHHVEAMKTIAYEIYYQVDEIPGTIFIPTSSGTLLLGIYRGFRDLKRLGYIERIPRLVAVQTRSYHPLYTAIKNKTLDPEEENLADGISIRTPPRLEQMIQAVKETGGDVVVVSNNEIREALRELIELGVIVEPTSATAIAGIKKAREMGIDTERAMAILTGSGLKMIQSIRAITKI